MEAKPTSNTNSSNEKKNENAVVASASPSVASAASTPDSPAPVFHPRHKKRAMSLNRIQRDAFENALSGMAGTPLCCCFDRERFHSFITFLAGSIIANCITYPLDLLTIRVQTASGDRTIKYDGFKRAFQSVIRCVKSMKGSILVQNLALVFLTQCCLTIIRAGRRAGLVSTEAWLAIW